MTCIEQMLTYYLDVFARNEPERAFQMHDPLCLAVAIQPDLISRAHAYVDVELAGSLTLGETVPYFQCPESAHANMQVSVDVDAERFVRLFLERIGQLCG